MSAPRRRLATRLLVPIVAGAALVAAGCSGDDSATPSTTTEAPTTTAPTTTTTVPGSNDPLPVAWVRQVGGAGDDELDAVTGRDDVVMGLGTSTGLTAEQRPASGSTSAFVDVVAAADGSARATVQSTQAHTASGRGISSATDGDLTVACGATTGPVAGASGPPSGVPDDDEPSGTEAWCSTVGTDGVLGTATVAGSKLTDALNGVAVSADGSRTYAAGGAQGLFPGAKDPTGGYLGDGDALITRLDANGAFRWARQFGSTAADEATGITTSDDGDAVAVGTTTGRTEGDVGGTVGGQDGWIARMDPDGSQRWMTQFGSAGQDRATAVASGGDPRRGTESYVAVGSTDGQVGTAAGLGGRDATIASFDASGRERWSTQLGSPADDEAAGVAIDGDTVYVTGTAGAAIIGGQQISLTPTPQPDQGSGGSTSTTTSSTVPPTTVPPTGGGKDGFLAALDLETGEIRWIAQFGSTADEVVTGMTRTESGLVVVSGSTTGQLGTAAPGGGRDGFMVAFFPPAGGGGAASIV